MEGFILDIQSRQTKGSEYYNILQELVGHPLLEILKILTTHADKSRAFKILLILFGEFWAYPPLERLYYDPNEIRLPHNLRKSYMDLETPENTPKVRSCLLYTSPSPRDGLLSRMPSSA